MAWLWIVIYVICGLINVFGLVMQSLSEDEGGLLPTEIVAAFLFWWIMLFVQIGVNIGAMIYMKNMEDNDER